jgi:hypothetical protein
MDTNQYVKPFRKIYFYMIILSLCIPVLMAIMFLASNPIEGLIDFIDYTILVPLEYGFPLFLIMILLGIAGIVIDSIRRTRYTLITFGYFAIIIFTFVYGFFFTVFFDFFNLRDFIH